MKLKGRGQRAVGDDEYLSIRFFFFSHVLVPLVQRSSSFSPRFSFRDSGMNRVLFSLLDPGSGSRIACSEAVLCSSISESVLATPRCSKEARFSFMDTPLFNWMFSVPASGFSALTVPESVIMGSLSSMDDGFGSESAGSGLMQVWAGSVVVVEEGGRAVAAGGAVARRPPTGSFMVEIRQRLPWKRCLQTHLLVSGHLSA